MESLGKQMEAYDKQREEYSSRIAPTQRDIHVTRRDIQKLNTQAALVTLPGAPLGEDPELDGVIEMDQELC